MATKKIVGLKWTTGKDGEEVFTGTECDFSHLVNTLVREFWPKVPQPFIVIPPDEGFAHRVRIASGISCNPDLPEKRRVGHILEHICFTFSMSSRTGFSMDWDNAYIKAKYFADGIDPY
jgi:hypothetical protein